VTKGNRTSDLPIEIDCFKGNWRFEAKFSRNPLAQSVLDPELPDAHSKLIGLPSSMVAGISHADEFVEVLRYLKDHFVLERIQHHHQRHTGYWLSYLVRHASLSPMPHRPPGPRSRARRQVAVRWRALEPEAQFHAQMTPCSRSTSFIELCPTAMNTERDKSMSGPMAPAPIGPMVPSSEQRRRQTMQPCFDAVRTCREAVVDHRRARGRIVSHG
jgi:hypothetical protein